MKSAVLAFWYEYKYDLLRQVRYKVSFFINALVFIFLYYFIVFANKSTSLTSYYSVSQSYDKILLLVGYTYWQFSSYALGISTYVIREEAASGILEAKLLGNYNVVLLLFARLLSGVIVCIVVQLFIIIVSVFLGVMQPSYFLKYCLTLIIYIPSFLGMFGMGLLLGGATLIYKNIGQCIFLIQTALLLVTNVLGMQSQISFFIIPYSIGIDIARRLFLSTSLLSWELFYYFFINIVWFTVGFKIFDILLKKNKQYGYFNSY